MWPFVDLLDDAVVVVDACGVIRNANRVTEAVFGHRPASMVGQPLDVLVPEPARARHHARFVGFGQSGDAHRRMSERARVVGRRADGTTFPADVSIIRIEDTETLFVAVVRDLSDRSALESEVGRLAQRDTATGLLNRATFVDEVDRWFDGGGSRGTVLCLDVRGHRSLGQVDAGNWSLAAVSSRLARLGGTDDGGLVARLGDSTFAVHLPAAVDERRRERWVRYLLNLLEQPVTVDGHIVRLSVSIGVRRCEPTDDATTLLADAQLALAHARLDPHRPVALFDQSMSERADTEAELEAGLGAAITAGQTWVAYQPIVATSTGAPNAAEALLRWTHPRLGEVPPDMFIPLAERSGQIDDLGRWVLNTVCDQIARWEGQEWFDEQFVVAVNASARQLEGPTLVNDLVRALARSGVRPARLRIELTESLAMSDVDATIDRLAEIADLGVGIGLDDFGTGYSSLAQLGRLPIDEIKLDRSFVAGISEDRSARAIIFYQSPSGAPPTAPTASARPVATSNGVHR